jgi:hypothetical protein
MPRKTGRLDYPLKNQASALSELLPRVVHSGYLQPRRAA